MPLLQARLVGCTEQCGEAGCRHKRGEATIDTNRKKLKGRQKASLFCNKIMQSYPNRWAGRTVG